MWFYFIFKVLVQLRSGSLEEVIKTLEAAVEVDTPPFVKKIEFSEQVVSIQEWEEVHSVCLSDDDGGSATEFHPAEVVWVLIHSDAKAAGWLSVLLSGHLDVHFPFLLWILLLVKFNLNVDEAFPSGIK